MRLRLMWLTTASLLACSSALEIPTIPDDAVNIPVERLDAADLVRYYSGLETRSRFVVRDAVTWEALWPQIVGARQPIPPTPPIDFRVNSVIVAAMGGRGSSGYAITIDGARGAHGDVWIDVTEKSSGCGYTLTVLTAPVALGVIPRVDGRAFFVEHARTVDCT